MEAFQKNLSQSVVFVKEIDLLSPYLFLFCMEIYSRMLMLGQDLIRFIYWH